MTDLPKMQDLGNDYNLERLPMEMKFDLEQYVFQLQDDETLQNSGN